MDDGRNDSDLDARAIRAQNERQRATAMDSAEFRMVLDELLEGLAFELFEDDWQRLTIVNRAKELALAVRLDGVELTKARREMVEFFERKRRFYTDEDDEPG